MTRVAAAAAIVAAAAVIGCGEKQESVPDVAPAEVHALAAAGLGAVGAEARGSSFTWTSEGATLVVRLLSPPRGGLASVTGSFESIHARVVAFCPKPALLRCRPALQASGVLRAGRNAPPVVAALRELAARTYEQRPLVRRGRNRTLIVTANGELLGAMRVEGRAVFLSFGGPRPPGSMTRAPAGRLVMDAGPQAIAATRPELGPRGRAALVGIRRLRAVIPLSQRRR